MRSGPSDDLAGRFLFVARMERSAIRDKQLRAGGYPDFVSLHPGYALNPA